MIAIHKPCGLVSDGGASCTCLNKTNCCARSAVEATLHDARAASAREPWSKVAALECFTQTLDIGGVLAEDEVRSTPRDAGGPAASRSVKERCSVTAQLPAKDEVQGSLRDAGCPAAPTPQATRPSGAKRKGAPPAPLPYARARRARSTCWDRRAGIDSLDLARSSQASRGASIAAVEPNEVAKGGSGRALPADVCVCVVGYTPSELFAVRTTLRIFVCRVIPQLGLGV